MPMNLSLGLGLGGIVRPEGVGAWVSTEVALRALYAANEGLDTAHTLDAMDTPPSVTVTGSTANPSGMGVTYTFVGGSLVPAYKGGGIEVVSTNYRRFPVMTVSSGSVQWTTWRVSVRTSAPKVAFSVNGTSGSKYRFLVRTPGQPDEYVDKAGTTVDGASVGFVVLDFGGAADRIVTVENQDNTSFRAVNVSDGYTATNPNEEAGIALYFGDSFTTGTGTTFKNDGFVTVSAEQLGFANIWASGVGGTGYLATNGATRYKLSERILADINRAKAIGTVSKVFVAMGLNDLAIGDVTAEAAACFDIIRAALPSASVSVLGPWDVKAPSAVAARFASRKAEIQAALAGRGGFHFLDTQGVEFTKSDGTHPDTAGHLTVGAWLAGAERTALAA